MQQSNYKKIQAVLIFVLLILLVVGLFFLVKELFSSSKLNFTALITIVVSFATIFFSKQQEYKIKIANQLHEKKIPIYEKIIEFIFSIAFQKKLGEKKPSEKEVMKFFVNTTKDLVIWGSKDIIEAYGNFKEESQNLPNAENNSPMKILSKVEDLMFAIRKDLGHNDIGMKRGDIMRLYITDLSEHLNKSNTD